jgi:hypothetical protein
MRFLDHTQRRATVDRTPLDEWSIRRRELYLTTHNNHDRQTSIHPVGFEPTMSAGERPKTNALDRTVTGTGINKLYDSQYKDCQENSEPKPGYLLYNIKLFRGVLAYRFRKELPTNRRTFTTSFCRKLHWMISKYRVFLLLARCEHPLSWDLWEVAGVFKAIMLPCSGKR